MNMLYYNIPEELAEPSYKEGDIVYPVPVQSKFLETDDPCYINDMESIQKMGVHGVITDIDFSFDYEEDEDGDEIEIPFWEYEVRFENIRLYRHDDEDHTYWYREEWIKLKNLINIDDLLEVTDKQKRKKKKIVRVVGFKIGNSKKVIGIVKRKKHKKLVHTSILDSVKIGNPILEKIMVESVLKKRKKKIEDSYSWTTNNERYWKIEC